MPELSNSSVLIAGTPHAPIGVNSSAKPGPAEGHRSRKPGHSTSLCNRLARSGTDITRAQNSAPKNPKKNITSEKMNQPIPQRNDSSSQTPYLPPSDSRITSPNQRNIMYSRSMKPSASPTQPPLDEFITNTAPSAMRNSAAEPMIGHGIGCGTW